MCPLRSCFPMKVMKISSGCSKKLRRLSKNRYGAGAPPFSSAFRFRTQRSGTQSSADGRCGWVASGRSRCCQAGVNVLDPQSGVKFIAVASGKGGVGKSTVTVNLAVALARLGKKVGLVDADIYGFSVPDMMGIEERPQAVENRIAPVERFGVKVISMGFFVEENTPVIWRGPMLGKMLRNFF